METLLIDVPYKVKHPFNIEIYRADFFTLKGYDDERGYNMYCVNCNTQKGFYIEITPTAYQKFLELENQIQYIPEKPQPREIWVNEQHNSGFNYSGVFSSKEEAEAHKQPMYIRSVKFIEVL